MARPKKNAETAVSANEEIITAAATTEEETTSKKKRASKKTEDDGPGAPFKEVYHTKMWFIQPLLGSAPGDPDLYKTFIASNAPDAPTREEELLTTTVADVAAKGVNIFRRRSRTGRPCVPAYTIKGYLKEAVSATNKQDGVAKLTAHKTKIGLNTNVDPAWINLQFPVRSTLTMNDEAFKEKGFCGADVVMIPTEGIDFVRHVLKTFDRPLRANTPKGEIVSIASSEMAPAGTLIEFDLSIESKELRVLVERLKRGTEHGTGQFRTSGIVGRFVIEFYRNGELVDGNTEATIGCTSLDPDFEEKLFDFIDETNL